LGGKSSAFTASKQGFGHSTTYAKETNETFGGVFSDRVVDRPWNQQLQQRFQHIA
jgi:hypothetical protein